MLTHLNPFILNIVEPMISFFSQWKYKALFVILLISAIKSPSFEFLIVLAFLSAVFFLNQRKQKISTDFFNALFPLIILFGLGLFISFFHSYPIVDIFRDISYFIKPILLFFVGYALMHSIKDSGFIFKIFVYLGIFYSVWHIFDILTYPKLFETSINTLRNNTGLSNDIELIAMIFLFLSLKFSGIQIFKRKQTSYWVLSLLTVSFILYFSRTMWLAIFLLLLTTFGYAKLSSKALKYIGIVLIIFISFYVYLYSVEIKRTDEGISAFLYKMKIAPAEIFLSKVNFKNHANLWDHWRAYEAKTAFDQMKGFQHITGRGFGSLVDLQFKAPLNEKGMRYISHLHNGYAMIYYKTGIIGLIVYLLFVLNLYLFTFYKQNTNQKFPINNLIASVGVYLFFSTLIISGAYNLEEIYLFTLGGFFAFYDKNKKSENQVSIWQAP